MIEKRRSPIQGWGVFATQPINKNKRIVHYAGEKISNSESLKRETRYLKKGHIWCFKLNRLYVRDAAVGGNVARYINHSCTPNCYTRVIGDTIWIIAARNIRKGEELTYDYSTDGVGTDPVPLLARMRGPCSDAGQSICTASPRRRSRPRRRSSRHGWRARHRPSRRRTST